MLFTPLQHKLLRFLVLFYLKPLVHTNRMTQQTIVNLADALGFGVVVLHDAKGMFPEGHPSFLGVYSPFYTAPVSVKQCYEAADGILLIGGLAWVGLGGAC